MPRLHDVNTFGALIRASMDGKVEFFERGEAEACPNCGGRHPSYRYMEDLFPDVPLAPGESFDRKWCLCGYAESPLTEADRTTWRQGI